jgi:hypothetical protein
MIYDREYSKGSRNEKQGLAEYVSNGATNSARVNRALNSPDTTLGRLLPTLILNQARLHIPRQGMHLLHRLS